MEIPDPRDMGLLLLWVVMFFLVQVEVALVIASPRSSRGFSSLRSRRSFPLIALRSSIVPWTP
eukprot:801526-Pleurochrysis_carterae.AAC.1